MLAKNMSASSRSGSNSRMSVCGYPERLRQHQRQTAMVDLLNRQPAVASGRPRVERYQGINAEQQVDALVERDRGMECLIQRAIDVVFAIDFDRREQARQRRGGGYRLVDRNVIDARPA